MLILIRKLLKYLSVFIASISLLAAKQKQRVNENELAAAVLVGEASIDGIEGMKAVSEVIRNRMQAGHKTMYDVVTERFAFSCLNNYRGRYQEFINKHKKHPKYLLALWIINNYRGNITRGALYFHEKKIKPYWAVNKRPVAIIGNHKFFAFAY